MNPWVRRLAFRFRFIKKALSFGEALSLWQCFVHTDGFYSDGFTVAVGKMSMASPKE